MAQINDYTGKKMEIIPANKRDETDTKRIVMKLKKDVENEELQEFINRYKLSNQINEKQNFVSYHTDIDFYSFQYLPEIMAASYAHLFEYKPYFDATAHVNFNWQYG